MHYTDVIRPLIEKARKNETEAIEKMCEKMLTQVGTDYGVLVVQRFNYNAEEFSASVYSEVSLSPEVPFGTIAYKEEGTFR